MQQEVERKISGYPEPAYIRLSRVKDLIYDVAKEEELGNVDVSLKWGEPSFVVKSGSPIRMDWKEKRPEYCGVYFNCKSLLVETFRQLYPDTFRFEGNRAILLRLDEPLPDSELKHCISMALRYHRIKHLPLLGN
ncbi:DUF1801 domain-containing protein [Pleionea sp. CnH1-48]|uniref:DUF1801 domain-containing protein n=1 Tax=Pleionea sp. CnH1-48 TaxID=2954494 RepID=UPI0020984A3E|nr:DUF1801 domain-containing protein [Pleionea sp. CnH1-48]MCO7226089.1 DUF1801 domain-containing protein [Pleionea sp. CnH1-48]